MRKLPSSFSTMGIELPQAMGSTTLRITPRFSMSSNSAFTLYQSAASTVLGGLIIGETVGSVSMW